MAVKKIVLTGGPCGGKTTALAQISDRLGALGYHVYVVPEAATMMFTNGVVPGRMSSEQLLHFQGMLIRLQIALEHSFTKIAEEDFGPTVVICDRGTMDSSAFLDDVMWRAVLDENGWTNTQLRDKRYDAVIHMVTAADGAEDFYTTENNLARTETPEQAREVDLKLRKAWLGHPHLRVIDNSTDFQGKVRRVIASLFRILGVPEPLEIERKFLVKSIDNSMPVARAAIEIEQTYLKSTEEGVCTRVRRRSQDGSSTYTLTTKKPIKDGVRIEIEKSISGREYIAFLSQADPELKTIKKIRHCFLWENQYFELDEFQNERLDGLILLEAELENEGQELHLPPFIDIEREVTDDPSFSNVELARRA